MENEAPVLGFGIAILSQDWPLHRILLCGVSACNLVSECCCWDSRTFLITFFFFFLFWLHPAAYGILVPQPGMEPNPPALGAWSLNHWTTRKIPFYLALNHWNFLWIRKIKPKIKLVNSVRKTRITAIATENVWSAKPKCPLLNKVFDPCFKWLPNVLCMNCQNLFK